MKTMTISLAFLCLCFNIQGQDKIELADFAHLANTTWTGTLMYVNYRDGKEVTVRTRLEITLGDHAVFQKVSYPDEPRKNSVSKVRIKKDGRYFGEEKIVEIVKKEGKIHQLVTTFRGRDDNKKATFLKKYRFGADTLSITKKVMYDGTGAELVRNRYTYIKK